MQQPRNMILTAAFLVTSLGSAFTGLDATHDVRGVTVENLRFHGHPITNAADAHLQIGKFAEEARFLID